ncbi:MAG: hypothetical protein K0R49_656, partial [Burkholderiales bacterium]|nr:hypothetical protein [Burkholderiales bacterium]
MSINSLLKLRTIKYGIMILLISISYFFGYQSKSEYFLHFTTTAKHLAVETVSWNKNGMF